jgi:hypothetical protein
MSKLIEQLLTKQEAREAFDFLPRKPLQGTKHAACLLIELLAQYPDGIPSKLLLEKARALNLSRFFIREARVLLRTKAKRIQLTKLTASDPSYRGYWLVCATPATHAAIQKLLAPPHAAHEPLPLSDGEQLLLALHSKYLKGRLKNKTVRLPDRTIHNAHTHAALFFSLKNPSSEQIQMAVEMARKLQETK